MSRTEVSRRASRLIIVARLLSNALAILAVAASASFSASNQFVILSDIHPARGAEPQLALLLEQLLELKPEFVVTLGDMNGDPEPDAGPDDLNHAMQLFHRLREAGIEIYPTVGNHDGNPKINYICNHTPPMNIEFDPAFNPTVAERWCGRRRFWYSFNRGGIHFAIINSSVSSGRSPSGESPWEAMRGWMVRDLCEHASNPNRFPTLVFMHHPQWITRDRGCGGPLFRLLSECPDNAVAAVFGGDWHAGWNFPPESNLGIQVYATEASVHLVVDDPEYIIATVHPDRITFEKVDTKTGGRGKTGIVYYPIPGKFTSLDDRS